MFKNVIEILIIMQKENVIYKTRIKLLNVN